MVLNLNSWNKYKQYLWIVCIIKNWKIIYKVCMFSSDREKAWVHSFEKTGCIPVLNGREIAELDDWEMRNCVFLYRYLIFCICHMWFSQPPIYPTGIMARWLSKYWKTFWHLWQVLFNSWVYEIPVLTKENNLAYYSKSKFHIAVVIWQITDLQNRLKNILCCSTFCAFTPDLGELVSFEPMIECDFTRKFILLLQKTLFVFMILCQGRNDVPDPWTLIAVSGVICGRTNSLSVHWLQALILLRQLEHSDATYGESVFS